MSQPRTPAVPRRRGEGALTMARREGGDGVGGTRPHHCVKRHLKRHPCRMHRQPTEAGEAQGPHLHGEQVADGEGRGAAGALRGVGDDGGTVRASARGGRVHLDPHCHRELLRRELGEAVGLNERTGLRVEQGERGGPGKQRRRRWRELQHAAGSQRARLDERPLGRVEGAHLPDGLSAWRSRQPRLAGGVTDHAVATAEAVALGGAVGLEHPQHRAGRLDVAGADTHGVDAEDTALGRVDGGRLGAAALGVVGVQVRLVGPALAHAVAGVHVASPGSAEMQVHVGHVAQPRVPREHKGGLARVELGHHENPFLRSPTNEVNHNRLLRNDRAVDTKTKSWQAFDIARGANIQTVDEGRLHTVSTMRGSSMVDRRKVMKPGDVATIWLFPTGTSTLKLPPRLDLKVATARSRCMI
mmetsp:Transcript_89065/g.237639  ORF Transcript_89065/g.237639 Transcript_89065/m.237639 type:complete len:414 (-) Transcript_89065:850-2091(-)